MGTVKYSPPQRISREHILEQFDCGETSLNDWLKKRAVKNDLGDASRTYVVCCNSSGQARSQAEGLSAEPASAVYKPRRETRARSPETDNTVVAYYSLHLGCIQHSEAVRKIKRNMPDPIPAIVLGRLAVDINHQSKGLARALIKDMFLRAIQVSDLAGTKAVLVKALNDQVTAFYQSFGFVRSKTDPFLLMKAIAEVRISRKLRLSATLR